jgi:hypothetical protein
MKIARITVHAVAFCLLVIAPLHADQPNDRGVTNGVYYSRYLGFTFPMPKGAVIASSIQNTNLVRKGTEALTENNPQRKSRLMPRLRIHPFCSLLQDFPWTPWKKANG